MKHQIYELRQMQSLPLSAKVSMTLRRIIEWKEYWESKGENVYVSWSGGKDSTVLKHIAQSFYPDIKLVYVDTGLEYPELKEFVRKEPNVEILHPDMPFWKVVQKYGYPVISKEVSECVENARKHINGGGIIHTTKNYLDLESLPQRVQKILGILKQRSSPNKSRYNLERWKPLVDMPFNISSRCCSIMKKKPLHNYNKINKSHPMTAEMAEESQLRTQEWLNNGCNGFDMKEPKSMPMSFWTEQDVLQYIKENNLEIPSVYGKIIDDVGIVEGYEQISMCDTGCKLKTTSCNRTGCMFCLYGSHLEKGLSRFQKLKITHPKIYEYCMGGGEFNEQGLWQPNQKGLGMKFVMDTINKTFGKNLLRY